MHHVLYQNLLTNTCALHCVYQIRYISYCSNAFRCL